MTLNLCLLHDCPDGRRPDYFDALSGLGDIISMRWGERARPPLVVGYPWLIDFTAIDRAKAAFLHISLAETGGAPRLFVTDIDDRSLRDRMKAFGAARIVPRPVDVAGIRRILLADRLSRRPVAERVVASRSLALKAVAGAAPVLEGIFEACIGGYPLGDEILREVASAVLPTFHQIGLGAWLEVMRDHHDGTYQHSLITMAIAAGFGRVLDLPKEDVHRLALAGLVHDIGKFWVPQEILSKPGELSPTEFAVVRQHSHDGWAVLRAAGLPLDEEVFDAILHHHEYLDGSGYPDGLRGDEISTLTRILTIADIYGALAETRSYRAALEPHAIRPILEAMADGGRIDGELLAALPLAQSA